MADKAISKTESPSFNKEQLTKNLGGMPATKTVDQIDKANTPPKSAPTFANGSRSVRV